MSTGNLAKHIQYYKSLSLVYRNNNIRLLLLSNRTPKTSFSLHNDDDAATTSRKSARANLNCFNRKKDAQCDNKQIDAAWSIVAAIEISRVFWYSFCCCYCCYTIAIQQVIRVFCTIHNLNCMFRSVTDSSSSSQLNTCKFVPTIGTEIFSCAVVIGVSVGKKKEIIVYFGAN